MANANPTITIVVSHGRLNTSSIVSSQKLRTSNSTANNIGTAQSVNECQCGLSVDKKWIAGPPRQVVGILVALTENKKRCGPYRDRTGHLLIANEALYQMS